uniref:Uncharacterized protein n=1 Tax=Rhodnius prolixus TaxID=13249 RepID=T1HX62_RHOPR
MAKKNYEGRKRTWVTKGMLRASPKLSMGSSPHRKKRLTTEAEGGFSSALAKHPPPIPPPLLRRLGSKEISGLGKVVECLKEINLEDLGSNIIILKKNIIAGQTFDLCQPSAHAHWVVDNVHQPPVEHQICYLMWVPIFVHAQFNKKFTKILIYYRHWLSPYSQHRLGAYH